jgi:hypothetical protein
MRRLIRKGGLHTPLSKALFRSYPALAHARVRRFFLAISLAALAALLALRIIYDSLYREASDLLVYVPIHLLSLGTLPGFLSCILGPTPVIVPRTFKAKTDLLIVSNGNRSLSARESRQIAHALRKIRHSVPYFRKVRIRPGAESVWNPKRVSVVDTNLE